jgi:aspartyl protease family protein
LRSAIGFFSAFALITGALLLLVHFIAPAQLQSSHDQSSLVYLVMLLVLIGGGGFGTSRANFGLAIKQALIWLAIFLLVAVAYSFREEFSELGNRLKAELLPSSPISVEEPEAKLSGSTVALRKSDDGHFHANARVNRAMVSFLVDTGASSIALTLQDANRVGFKTRDLNFSVPISTASGMTFGAPIMLDKVAIGQITVRDVQAIVIKDGLDTSLLGMSFLGRLQKFEASRNQLILKK